MMGDQCKHCTLRGNLNECKATACYQKENWHAVEQQRIIDEQRMLIIDLRASLRTCFNSSQGALDLLESESE